MSFPSYSIWDHLAEGSMASFQQGELIKVLLAHEASNLPGTVLAQLPERERETEELEEQITEEPEEQQHSERKLAVKEDEEQPTELTNLKVNEDEEQPTEFTKFKAKELEEQTKELTKQVKELEAQTTDLTEKVKELAEKNKELEEQQTGLDSALVKAALSQLSAKEAKKSFKKIASTQLPQQEVKGAWLEQLASEQQLILSSLSFSFDNFMVKYATFQEKEEFYQSSFSESSFSENILQTSLANSAQWPSLCSQSWQHHGSLLASQQKEYEKQLFQELTQRVHQIQLCRDLLAEWLAALPAYSVAKQEQRSVAYSSGVALHRDEET